MTPLLGSPGPPYSVAPTSWPVPGGPSTMPVAGAGRRRSRTRSIRGVNTLVSSASSAAPKPAAIDRRDRRQHARCRQRFACCP